MALRLITVVCTGFVGACAQLAPALPPEPTPSAALAFDRLTPGGEPFGWYLEADAETVAIGVERPEAGAGATLVLRNAGEEPALLYTMLPQDGCVRSQSLTFQARSESDGRASGAFIHGDLGGVDFKPPAPLTADWRTVAHEVRSDSCLQHGAAPGLVLYGDVQVRELEIRANGQRLDAPRLSRPEAADFHALQRAASGPDPADGGPALRRLFERRVVALGEASHGAAALFAFKLEILQALAERGELGMIALELPAAAGDVVDAYTSGRTNDREAVRRALVYPAWRTEEMLAVVDWLRAFNAAAERPVRFAGFDVQHPIWAARGLQEAGVDMSGLAAALNAGDLDGALERLDALEPQWSGVEGGPRYARLLRRGLLVDRIEAGGRSRAAYMALEVEALADAAPGRVVLWADNTHVTRQPGAMGRALADALGDDYAAVGLSFGAGAYAAYGPETPYRADPAYAGTHEHLLNAAGLDGVLIALADLPADHPLREPRGWRYIGSRPQAFDQFLPHRLGDHFDAIGYVRTSDATTYLDDPQF